MDYGFHLHFLLSSNGLVESSIRRRFGSDVQVIEHHKDDAKDEQKDPFRGSSASSPEGSTYPLLSPQNEVGAVFSSPNSEFHNESKTYQIEVSIESGLE